MHQLLLQRVVLQARRVRQRGRHRPEARDVPPARGSVARVAGVRRRGAAQAAEVVDQAEARR